MQRCKDFIILSLNLFSVYMKNLVLCIFIFSIYFKILGQPKLNIRWNKENLVKNSEIKTSKIKLNIDSFYFVFAKAKPFKNRYKDSFQKPHEHICRTMPQEDDSLKRVLLKFRYKKYTFADSFDFGAKLNDIKISVNKIRFINFHYKHTNSCLFTIFCKPRGCKLFMVYNQIGSSFWLNKVCLKRTSK